MMRKRSAIRTLTLNEKEGREKLITLFLVLKKKQSIKSNLDKLTFIYDDAHEDEVLVAYLTDDKNIYYLSKPYKLKENEMSFIGHIYNDKELLKILQIFLYRDDYLIYNVDDIELKLIHDKTNKYKEYFERYSEKHKMLYRNIMNQIINNVGDKLLIDLKKELVVDEEEFIEIYEEVINNSDIIPKDEEEVMDFLGVKNLTSISPETIESISNDLYIKIKEDVNKEFEKRYITYNEVIEDLKSNVRWKIQEKIPKNISESEKKIILSIIEGYINCFINGMIYNKVELVEWFNKTQINEINEKDIEILSKTILTELEPDLDKLIKEANLKEISIEEEAEEKPKEKKKRTKKSIKNIDTLLLSEEYLKITEDEVNLNVSSFPTEKLDPETKTKMISDLNLGLKKSAYWVEGEDFKIYDNIILEIEDVLGFIKEHLLQHQNELELQYTFLISNTKDPLYNSYVVGIVINKIMTEKDLKVEKK